MGKGEQTTVVEYHPLSEGLSFLSGRVLCFLTSVSITDQSCLFLLPSFPSVDWAIFSLLIDSLISRYGTLYNTWQELSWRKVIFSWRRRLDLLTRLHRTGCKPPSPNTPGQWSKGYSLGELSLKSPLGLGTCVWKHMRVQRISEGVKRKGLNQASFFS